MLNINAYNIVHIINFIKENGWFPKKHHILKSTLNTSLFDKNRKGLEKIFMILQQDYKVLFISIFFDV